MTAQVHTAIEFSAREFSSAAECIANAQRLKRMFAPRPEPNSAEKEEIVLRLVEAPREAPLCQHDAHVIAWRLHLGMAVGVTPRDYLRCACKVRGLIYDEIRSDSRVQALVVPRYELIVELHEKYPHLSLPQLGKIFNRDHTTILAAFRKQGLRKPGASIADHADEMKRLFDLGLSQENIGIAIGYSKFPVGKFIKRQGWTRP